MRCDGYSLVAKKPIVPPKPEPVPMQYGPGGYQPTFKEDGESKPPKSLPVRCDHKYKFMETTRHYKYSPYGSNWHRTDIFYCEKCLDMKMLSKVACSETIPNWY